MVRVFIVRLVGNVVGSVVAWFLIGWIPARAVEVVTGWAWVELWSGLVAIALLLALPGRMVRVMRGERLAAARAETRVAGLHPYDPLR